MTIVANCQPWGTNTGSSLCVVDPDTFEATPIVSHPNPSRAYARPIVNPRSGLVAWYELAAGDSVNNPLGGQQLIVGGVQKPFPRTWGPRGHVEWSPGGTRMVHAAWRSYASPPAVNYQLITHDASVKNCKVISEPGIVEPSWSKYGILAIDSTTRPIGLVMLSASGSVRWRIDLDVSDHPWDPYISPDGSKVISLAFDGGLFNGLRLHDVQARTWRWLYISQPGGAVVTNCSWLDDNTVIGATRLPGDWDWSVVLIDVESGHWRHRDTSKKPEFSISMPVYHEGSVDFGDGKRYS